MESQHAPEAVDVVAAAAPMETLLADAGIGSLRRWLPGQAGFRFATALARDPAPVVRQLGGAATELARVVTGRSEVAPDRKDRRFADPAWTGNPVLRRVAQSYLVAAGAAERIVEGAEVDWRTGERMRFLTSNLVEALAPSNNPLLNPAAWKAAIDTGGASLVRGGAALVRDLAAPPRVPRMVEPNAHAVGRDLGLTPGEVVFRNPVFELIQYAPQTDRVRSAPLLVVPPTINKFYVVDLAPGRSLVEHLVLLVEHRDAEVFAWLRPRDLVWNRAHPLRPRAAIGSITTCWASRRRLTSCPGTPDTTRMAARLHRDFIELAEANKLVTPGAATMLGTPVDLSAVHVDAYVVAGIADHLCPWQNCYATTQLLGGKSRFVLSTSGHVAAIVNPPGNPKASYQVGEDNPADPERWRERAARHTGSWWDDYTEWLGQHAGPERAAPVAIGGPGFAPLGPAPGTYVLAR